MPDEPIEEEEPTQDELIDMEDITLYGEMIPEPHGDDCICEVCLATP